MMTPLAAPTGFQLSSHWSDAGPTVGVCQQCHQQERAYAREDKSLETAPGAGLFSQLPDVILVQLTDGDESSKRLGEHACSLRRFLSRLAAYLVFSCPLSKTYSNQDLVEMAVPCDNPWRNLLLAAALAAGAALVVYLCALPKPLPGIPYNKRSSRRLLGDVSEIRQSTYRRRWIWSQPGVHQAPISQAFLFPFRRPTVIVSDYRTAVDICSRRVDEFDRGTRNRECVGLTAPSFHFTMQSSDPRLKWHRELLRDLMTPWFLREVGYDSLAPGTHTH